MVLVSDQLYIYIDLYKLEVCIFGLAVVCRLRQAGQPDLLPRRGEPHDHGGVEHGLVLPHRAAEARYAPTPRGPSLAPCGGALGTPPCSARRGHPALLALGAARLSGVVPPPPRAHPALPALEAPAGLDAGLLGRADGARRQRHRGERAAPSQACRPPPPAEGPHRPRQPSLDGRPHPLAA